MAWRNQFSDFGAVTPHQNHPVPNMPVESAHASGQKDASVIAQLQPGICSNAITGVIIAKGEPRCIPSKKDGNPDRYVINMTLRDSPSAFINLQLWGSQEYSRDLASNYRIGDVVEIGQAMVQSKATDGTDEKFRPATPSQYQLSLSENKSTMKQYGGWSSERFTKLLHTPTKPANDFFTLSDIITNGSSLHEDHINILAAVRSVGASKDITTKTGRQLKRCEVKLFDETMPSFAFVLWDEELISLAQTWQPKDNVLFLADVRVTYDDFRKTMISTATAKTIITVNPDSREAYSLYQYARDAELAQLPGTGSLQFTADLSTITSVHTIEEVRQQGEGATVGPGGDAAPCGIVYAAVTTLDLDSESSTVTTIKCSKCRRRVEPGLQQCMNSSCPIGSAMGLGVDQDLETSFSLSAALSDHTGTLTGCSLQGEVANKMLNCTVDQYLSMTEDARTELKWDFLLERCKVYYKVQPATPDFPQPKVIILSCEKADIQDVVKHIR